GVATPAPDATAERLLQFWMHPWSAIKAAMSARQKVKVSTVAGRKVLTIPLAAPLENSPLTVTLDAKNLPERIEARLAGRALEANYSNYQDFEPMYSDYLPGHIVQKRDGQVVLDLTVTKAASYNPYVIFPIP